MSVMFCFEGPPGFLRKHITVEASVGCDNVLIFFKGFVFNYTF